MGTEIRIVDSALGGEQCHVMRTWTKDQHRDFDERIALLMELQSCPHFKAAQIAYWEIHDAPALHAYFWMRENPATLKTAYDDLLTEITATESRLSRMTAALFDLQRDALRYVNYVEMLKAQAPILATDAEYARRYKKLRRALPAYVFP